MASASLSPMYPGKIRHVQGLLSTANTNRDGTGTMLDLFVADSTNGSIVERISFIAAGAISTASSANVIRMWAKTGSTYRFLREFTITAVTPTASVAGGMSGANSGTNPDPYVTVNIKLASTETLAFSIHTVAGTQDNYHVNAEGGDYSVS